MLHGNLMPRSSVLKTIRGQGLQEAPGTRKNCNLIIHFLYPSHVMPAGNQ